MTFVNLQDVSYFPDGRSVVNTIGGRRFKVISRGMREGYHTAKVDFIKDEPETEPADLQSKLRLGSISISSTDWINGAVLTTVPQNYSKSALHTLQ